MAEKAKWFLKFSVLALTMFLLIGQAHSQQKSNSYGLKVLSDYAEYQASVVANPDKELMNLEKYIPGIVLDIKYATTDNFTGKPVYQFPMAFLRKPAAEKLRLIQAELAEMNLALKIFDGYRPYSVTVEFYKLASNKDFVANPKDGSRHNRGCAVDLTLIDLKTGKELAMPTPYDDFTEMASPDYTKLPAEVIKNRDILIKIMHKHGFKVYRNEWWHFDFVGWEQFELMDLPFEKLEGSGQKERKLKGRN
jgi:D-alanyl-D-alanine dipeptidase